MHRTICINHVFEKGQLSELLASKYCQLRSVGIKRTSVRQNYLFIEGESSHLGKMSFSELSEYVSSS